MQIRLELNRLRLAICIFFISCSIACSNNDNQTMQNRAELGQEKSADVAIITKYYDDGSLKSMMGIDKDSLGHGAFIKYHPNGQIASEAKLVHGIYNGRVKYYNLNGVLLERVHVKNGKLHGLANYYYPSGNLERRGMFFWNWPDGYQITYYDRKDRLVPKMALFYLATDKSRIAIEKITFGIDGKQLSYEKPKFIPSNISSKKIEIDNFITVNIDIGDKISGFDSCRYYYNDYPADEIIVFDSTQCSKTINSVLYSKRISFSSHANFLGSRVIKGVVEGFRTIVEQDTVYEQLSAPIFFEEKYEAFHSDN